MLLFKNTEEKQLLLSNGYFYKLQNCENLLEEANCLQFYFMTLGGSNNQVAGGKSKSSMGDNLSHSTKTFLTELCLILHIFSS